MNCSHRRPQVRRSRLHGHLPDPGTLFFPDFVMLYLGRHLTSKGDLLGLLDAIDIAVDKNLRRILFRTPIVVEYCLTERDGKSAFNSTLRFESREERDRALKSGMERGMVAG